MGNRAETTRKERAILKFIEKFESDDDSWIDEINNRLWRRRTNGRNRKHFIGKIF